MPYSHYYWVGGPPKSYYCRCTRYNPGTLERPKSGPGRCVSLHVAAALPTRPRWLRMGGNHTPRLVIVIVGILVVILVVIVVVILSVIVIVMIAILVAIEIIGIIIVDITLPEEWVSQHWVCLFSGVPIIRILVFWGLY